MSRDNLTGQPVVNFLLTSEGGEIFYKLTSANVGKVLAVALDNKVKAQATIQDLHPRPGAGRGLRGGGGRATSPSCCARARCPCRWRSSASRPSAPPSARTPSARASTRALLGLGLVFVFMLLYYRRAGFNAVVAQILNLYFMVAILSVVRLHPHPGGHRGPRADGRHGRGRERADLRAHEGGDRGWASPTQAVVKAGFDRAFWAIADSNITTIIAALVLIQLRQGQHPGLRRDPRGRQRQLRCSPRCSSPG